MLDRLEKSRAKFITFLEIAQNKKYIVIGIEFQEDHDSREVAGLEGVRC